jgi:heavy metal sensor kinase
VIASLRARLTVWYVSVLAAVLVGVSLLIYILLARSLHQRIDENLVAVTGIAVTSLTNDLAEGQTIEDAAQSTAAELFTDQSMLAIYSGDGTLLAEQGRDDELEVALPGQASIPDYAPLLYTASEADDDDDRHRLAIRRVQIEPSETEYIILVGADLERTDQEIAALRDILLSVVPAALIIAGIGGWFLARKSLAPVMAMAARARRIGVGNLDARLPVSNPRDELGQLAGTFNELLARLSASFVQQRQFMADASHELRTPVATARTAASVALQQPRRAESEYRESLQIIEQQTNRLTRVVEDMFTLARADAGNYPVQRTPLYLDEVVQDVVRAAKVLASRRGIAIQHVSADSASFRGDEELLRRMVANLVDNAVRYAPDGSTVGVHLTERDGRHVITVADTGAGVPPEAQAHIFERFFRRDESRRRRPGELGGAGLGLAIARWVALQHSGEITLVESTGIRTVFQIELPVIDGE